MEPRKHSQYVKACGTYTICINE